jgi:5-methylcytosine-specific restriction enzyme subunit McrC
VASIAEQELLVTLGRSLARKTDRFGRSLPDSKSSLIHVRRLGRGECEIEVLDAVGVIATPSLIIDVQPKIPRAHLIYLLERGNAIPRMGADTAALAPDTSFFQLVARWFSQALDQVLEQGLARDYRLMRDDVRAARGRVIPLATADHYYRGRTTLVAEFEEFDFDTPLNRLLLHAARLVRANVLLPDGVRRGARRAIARMDGVGELRHGDLHCEPERRTSYYGDAALLARQIINGTGRSLLIGNDRVWTFLMRTPTPVEQGLRDVLRQALPPHLKPAKRQLALEGSKMTLNPDLVFGDTNAIADIKYKVSGSDWDRADLYEVVAFATGFRASDAAIVDFQAGAKSRPTVSVGGVTVRHVAWPTRDISPEAALADVAFEIVAWSNEWKQAGESEPATASAP